MMEKIAQFALMLALIAWNVVDIVSGNATIFSWGLLGVFSVLGIGEAAGIFSTRKTESYLLSP